MFQVIKLSDEISYDKVREGKYENVFISLK